MFKSFVIGFLFLFLIAGTGALPGQTTTTHDLIKGCVTDNITGEPVCLAEISCKNKGLYIRTNSNGGFVLSNTELPAEIKVCRFGYEDKTVLLSNPDDSLLISLEPLELHRSVISNKRTLQYAEIFKRALGKLKYGGNSGSFISTERKLVFCHISVSVDSTVRSLFESYAPMNVNRYTIRISHPDLSRYAVEDEYIPGLSEDRLYFNVDPYINLPIFPEKYITLKKFLVKDGQKIVVVRTDIGNTRNIYYINLADTSILYIKGSLMAAKRISVPGSSRAWQDDRVSTAEISFARRPESPESYFIDYAGTDERYRLIQKDKPDQVIARQSYFCIVPDSSRIYNSVNSEVGHEALKGIKRQINFNEKVIITGQTTPFRSETEKLLMKPYSHDFWANNLYVSPVPEEQNRINNWEYTDMFYSEDHHISGDGAESIGLDSLTREMNANLVAIENVYIETDRQDYLAGDTIWFSAFVLDNLHMDSTSLSRILYVDLINADNKPEKHLKLLITNGRTNGEIALDKGLKNGIYRLRAYTQYMRNFQGEYLFEKDIPVHRSEFKDILMVDPVINKSLAGDSIDLYFHTILPEQYITTERTLDILVRLNDTLSVKRSFSFTRNFKGSMGFFVPASLNCPSAEIKITLSGQAVNPEQRISLKLKPGINLQFFPESGKMVAGIPTAIAYKALDNKGDPAEFSGDIIDQYQQIIKQIEGNGSGVGKFVLTPKLNHSYKARILSMGSKYDFELPAVEPEGYVLNFNTNSDEIVIRNNQNYSKSRHYLLFTLRGAVYASMKLMLDTSTVHISLPLDSYPKGIVQITLYDSLFRPLVERLIFNNRADRKLLVHVETAKKSYEQREKVRITISVTDSEGNPVESSLALSVIDASGADTTANSADIESYLYLASELKGRIDPGLLNLSDTSLIARRNTDLVMMTQGWRNYLWNSIRYSRVMEVMYPIEKGFCINGNVINYENERSFSGHTINYFDLKNGFNGISAIDEDNRFSFDIPFFFGNHVIFMQNRNKRDKVDKMDYILDTLSLPEIRYKNTELPYNTYRAGYLKSLDKKYTEADSLTGQDIKYIKLGEVTVTAKSHPWYSKPDVTINLEKKDPTGKKYNSIMQMIYAEFGEKAFTATGYDTKGKMHMPILVANGDILTAGTCPPCYDPIYYPWALSIPVNEVNDVKFYEAGSKFSQRITPPPPIPGMGGGANWLTVPPPHLESSDITIPRIFLPVVSFTTYSNSYRGNPKGAIVFSYQGIYQAKEFYIPDYEKVKTDQPDSRTTIYWNPEINTDQEGRAEVTFFNSDLKGKALIRICGISFSLKDAGSVMSDYLSH